MVKTFTQDLIAQRVRAGLTQAQAAAIFGVAPRTLRGWEIGDSTPPMVTQRGALVMLQEVQESRQKSAPNGG